VGDEFGAFIDAGEFQKAVQHIDACIKVAPPKLKPVFQAFAAIAAWGANEKDLADSLLADAMASDPDFSIADLRPFDLAYVDQSIPERRYEILRQLGVPEK
jgi:hypothetical protein